MIATAPDACPGRFCFLFVEVGDRLSWDCGGVAAGAAHDQPRCGLPGTGLGLSCSRDEPPGTEDCYEPDEPALDKAGLPWTHFVRPGGA